MLSLQQNFKLLSNSISAPYASIVDKPSTLSIVNYPLKNKQVGSSLLNFYMKIVYNNIVSTRPINEFEAIK